jgi:hypothetical protein
MRLSRFIHPRRHPRRTADGSHVKSEALVTSRCQLCCEIQEDVQPRPGRGLAACLPCAKKVTAALEPRRTITLVKGEDL